MQLHSGLLFAIIMTMVMVNNEQPSTILLMGGYFNDAEKTVESVPG